MYNVHVLLIHTGKSTKVHLYWCMKNCALDPDNLRKQILNISQHYQVDLSLDYMYSIIMSTHKHHCVHRATMQCVMRTPGAGNQTMSQAKCSWHTLVPLRHMSLHWRKPPSTMKQTHTAGYAVIFQSLCLCIISLLSVPGHLLGGVLQPPAPHLPS